MGIDDPPGLDYGAIIGASRGRSEDVEHGAAGALERAIAVVRDEKRPTPLFLRIAA